jgi:hypothetical protein
VAQDFTLAQIQKAVPTAAWAELSDGAIATLNTVNIPKGSANVELAHEFINFILDPAVQQKNAEQGVDAPILPSVTLTPEQAKLWTYGADMIGKLKIMTIPSSTRRRLSGSTAGTKCSDLDRTRPGRPMLKRHIGWWLVAPATWSCCCF